MARSLILALLLLSTCCMLHAQPAQEGAWRDNIKSVQLYRSGAELDFPILVMGQEARLILEFDILKPEAESLEWRLRHCDRNWMPDNLEANEFLTGLANGQLTDYDFSFNTRVDYVHYTVALPGDFAEFIHSGNYIVEVYTPGDPTVGSSDTVLITRRFCVTEQSVAINAEVTVPYDGIERDRRQEVDVMVNDLTNEQWTSVVVMQNGREDTRRTLRLSGYDRQAKAYRYKPENVFWAGNDFRYFDCSNLGASMYNVMHVEDYGGQLFAILRPDESRAHRHYLSETTLFGGWKTNIWDRQNPRLEADYVWVNFSMPMQQPIMDGSIYIVGELTDWRLDSTSRMDYDMNLRTYTKRLLLKQGYYSYQLLVQGPRTAAMDSKTARLEGDHRETPNTYTVYVYQHAPADLADRLMGVARVKP